MSLQELFIKTKSPLLNIYFTAGFPHVDSMPEILAGLKEAGVDMVEIGMPYSDPLSDGPTIQNSNSIAISNGITTDKIFEQLDCFPSKINKIIMAYFNSVFQFGIDKFCARCQACGISGVILPDLPLDIYLEKYKTIFERHSISVIFLITPETSEERIRHIDQCSTSFIYVVSSSSTTGKETGIQSAKPYLDRLNEMHLKSPLMVGFNISTKEDFNFASNHTAGGIIGSAFIKSIKKSNNLKKDIHSFIKSIR